MNAGVLTISTRQGSDSPVPLLVTKLTNNKGLLTKSYSLGADGTLREETRAALYSGMAETVRCDDLAAFLEMRADLNASQALMYGVTGLDAVKITTQKELRAWPAQHEGCVARDSESFHYARAPGIFFGDHDAGHLTPAYSRETLRAALLAAVPELEQAPMAWATSASSYIVNADTGSELQGLKGQRIYIPLGRC
jgi:hypothetical protein